MLVRGGKLDPKFNITVPESIDAVDESYQFVATAVAEKLSALQAAEFFADRKARADFKAFDKLMKRRGGTPPRAGDEMPDSKTKTLRHVRNDP